MRRKRVRTGESIGEPTSPYLGDRDGADAPQLRRHSIRRKDDRRPAPRGPWPTAAKLQRSSWLPLLGSLVLVGLLIGLILLSAVLAGPDRTHDDSDVPRTAVSPTAPVS